MHKIKLRGKFFKSLNFRIMVIIFLAGTIPAVLLSFLALASYTEQSMIRLGGFCSIFSRSLRMCTSTVRTSPG